MVIIMVVSIRDDKLLCVDLLALISIIPIIIIVTILLFCTEGLDCECVGGKCMPFSGSSS